MIGSTDAYRALASAVARLLDEESARVDPEGRHLVDRIMVGRDLTSLRPRVAAWLGRHLRDPFAAVLADPRVARYGVLSCLSGEVRKWRQADWHVGAPELGRALQRAGKSVPELVELAVPWTGIPDAQSTADRYSPHGSWEQRMIDKLDR